MPLFKAYMFLFIIRLIAYITHQSRSLYFRISRRLFKTCSKVGSNSPFYFQHIHVRIWVGFTWQNGCRRNVMRRFENGQNDREQKTFERHYCWYWELPFITHYTFIIYTDDRFTYMCQYINYNEWTVARKLIRSVNIQLDCINIVK